MKTLHAFQSPVLQEAVDQLVRSRVSSVLETASAHRVQVLVLIVKGEQRPAL